MRFCYFIAITFAQSGTLKVEGLITACGFVTLWFREEYQEPNQVKGQTIVYGIVQKRPEVRISPDLRSFRLRKKYIAADKNKAFYRSRVERL